MRCVCLFVRVRMSSHNKYVHSIVVQLPLASVAAVDVAVVVVVLVFILTLTSLILLILFFPIQFIVRSYTSQ